MQDHFFSSSKPSYPQVCPMMPVLHHLDIALSASSHLPEEAESCRTGTGERTASPVLSAAMETSSNPPRLLVIREELISLTGHPLIAAVLGQLLYWSYKVDDLELYLAEERADPPKPSSTLQQGWFYKPLQELLEETMMRVTLTSLRRYLAFLKSRGWIQTRRNPHNKLDARLHYRVNLRKLSLDLQKKGYSLREFKAYDLALKASQEGSAPCSKEVAS